MKTVNKARLTIFLIGGMIFGVTVGFFYVISQIHSEYLKEQECYSSCFEENKKWTLSQDDTCLCYGELECVAWE